MVLDTVMVNVPVRRPSWKVVLWEGVLTMGGIRPDEWEGERGSDMVGGGMEVLVDITSLGEGSNTMQAKQCPDFSNVQFIIHGLR